jgi:hypothetical protein
MTRKKTLSDYSPEDLQRELLRRWAKEHFTSGMTMTQMEITVWEAHGMENPAALRALQALLDRLPLEKATAKLCPRCGKRVAPKARDRQRTLRTMAGALTLTRNYHYCERCQHGFYPLDVALDLPEEGELTREMEKRVLDFAINDVYGECVARWKLHYREQISENLLRRVVSRVGEQCESSDATYLQEELKAPADAPAEVLVIEHDGSMLPIRGEEPWKEAKVGVVYRHDLEAKGPVPGTARYVAVVNGLGEFAPVFKQALEVEGVDEARTVLWVGDGAVCNWTLADQLAPDAVQILDWYHAVQHAVDCGKVLLGEENPFLPMWKTRAEELLAAGDTNALIGELMECVPLLPKRRRDSPDAMKAVDDLLRYYRANAHRMAYRYFRESGYPIGSGAAESAHRHVLQVRMKRAGQRWRLRNARRMAQLRAAYRTAGAINFYGAVIRARRRTAQQPRRRSGDFRYARYGRRDINRCERNRSSN